MTDYHWWAVHWPRPLTVDNALEMLRRLASERSRAPFVVEAIGSNHQVRFRLGVPVRAISTARQLFAALLPGAVLEDATDAVAAKAAIRLTARGVPLGLRTTRPIEASRSLLAALSAANEAESLVLQLFLGEGIPAHISGRRAPDPRQGMLSQLVSGPREATSELASRMREKAGEHAIKTMIRIGVDAADVTRRHNLLKGVVGALRLSQSAGTSLSFTNASAASLSRIPQVGFLHLTPDEILGLASWPLGDGEMPGLASLHPKSLRLRGPDIKTDRTFGVTTAAGGERPVGISIEDAVYHSQFVGPTGVGKTTLLTNLVVADMEAGRSIVVVDPKAEWVLQDILARVPYKRRGDIALLDPLTDAPLGLNPLNQPGRLPELVADSIVTTIRNLFPNLFGPRTSDVLYASLLTLVGIPGATMTWLVRLLTEPGFRVRILAQIEDEMLISYWQEFDSMSAAQQAQFVGPVLTRLRQFVLRPQLRRVLDQAEPKFDLAELFSGPPKILLVPLNTALLGTEATALLGGLLVTTLWGHTLGRATVPASERAPVSIFIDEASEFLKTSGADIEDALARSRSLNVAWHFGFQYRGQFQKPIQDALDANARSTVVFSPSMEDAKWFAARSTELETADLLALPKYHVYANLMRDAEATGWFSARTLPAPPKTSDPEQLIRRAQRTYGQAPSEQPKKLTTQPPSDSEFGRRRRSS